MSSLMKSTATQENPIYNIDIPDPSLVTNPPTTTDAEIPVSPVSTRIGKRYDVNIRPDKRESNSLNSPPIEVAF